MKNIQKIFLIFLFIFNLTLVACGASDQSKVLIEDAVYTNGDLDPANEGKVVIVTGQISFEKVIYDDYLGVEINAPVAIRYGDMMHIRYKDLFDKSDPEYNWKTAWDARSDRLFADTILGDFTVSNSIWDTVLLDGIYGEYDESRLNEVGLTYFRDSKSSKQHFLLDISHQGIEKLYDVDFKDGECKYYYSCFYLSEGSEVTIIGRQVGSTIESIEEISDDNLAVFKGKLSPAEVRAEFGLE
ncbi:MAG: hypothetical protein GX326_00255 [Clostridiaceae bacterium]|nr:hypothetical protein [Clostridiaceae bacterium]